jgi:hypothetical protein
VTLGLAVLVAFAVLGVIVATVAIFLQRGSGAADLSLAGLLRAYLYLGSLAGVIVFAAGLAALLSYILGAALGLAFVYGGSAQPAFPSAAPAQLYIFGGDEPAGFLRVRQAEDLVRGGTFVLFGTVFWALHWLARGIGSAQHSGGLHRTYLLLGTAVFGLGTAALLPFGVYQALSHVLITTTPGSFRQGVGETLPSGLAALALWTVYLGSVVRSQRMPA